MSKSSKQAGNASSAQNNNTNTLKVRLDKWLWAARFYKTRSIAKEMIDGGKVHYEGQRVKPSKEVSLDATVRLRQSPSKKQRRKIIQFNQQQTQD